MEGLIKLSSTYQTNRNHLTYILRPRRPAPRHSALNPTILTRVVSHTRPKKHLGLYFVVWRGESGEMPILGFRHEDSRDFLLCQPITTRWHISSFGTKSLSSTLAPRYQSFHSPITLRLFRMFHYSPVLQTLQCTVSTLCIFRVLMQASHFF